MKNGASVAKAKLREGHTMPEPRILDVVLVLLLLAALVSGYTSGLVRSLSGIVGMVVGGIAAYFLVPMVGPWIPAVEWRTLASVAVAIALILGGLSIGASIGIAAQRQVERSKLRVADRIVGAAVAVVAAALVASMLAFSVGALGVPLLSPAIASSGVIRTIDGLTPDSLKSFLARIRSVAVQDGLPLIVDAFSGPTPTVPDFDTDNPALATAAQSVVRVTGNAYACGQNQSGSGFVVAEGRVLTNAHVVAGVAAPIVEVPGGGALPGRIVYFDPIDDLAVIAVEGLATPALRTAANLSPTSRAVSDGYPFGGPFDSDPAEVISVGAIQVADIYGQNPATRQAYTLAADVQQGESGGPLLSEAGEVVGVIFAKAATTPNVGYALGMDEVAPVIARAASLSAGASSGTCIRG